MVRIVRGIALTAAACLAVVGGGCGNMRAVSLPDSGATLEGEVKYGGEPLQFAQVMVLGDNRLAVGRIGEDGRYRVENCPLGEVKVGVNTSAARGEYQSKVMAGANKGPDGKGKGAVSLRFVDVPEKYFDPERSGFTTTVSAGANRFDLAVPKK